MQFAIRSLEVRGQLGNGFEARIEGEMPARSTVVPEPKHWKRCPSGTERRRLILMQQTSLIAQDTTEASPTSSYFAPRCTRATG